MKRYQKILLLFVYIVSLVVVFDLGKKYVIYNASITNENHDPGFYELELNGRVDLYYYE